MGDKKYIVKGNNKYRLFEKDHPCGTDINVVVNDLIFKANIWQEPVVGHFNHVELIAYPYMHPQTLIAHYFGACSNYAKKCWDDYSEAYAVILMRGKDKMSSIKYQEYLLESLRDPKEIIGYLKAAYDGGDRESLIMAVHNVLLANVINEKEKEG